MSNSLEERRATDTSNHSWLWLIVVMQKLQISTVLTIAKHEISRKSYAGIINQEYAVAYNTHQASNEPTQYHHEPQS